MLSVQHAIYFAARAERAYDAGAAVASILHTTTRDRILERMSQSDAELYYSWATETIAVVDMGCARPPRASGFAS